MTDCEESWVGGVELDQSRKLDHSGPPFMCPARMERQRERRERGEQRTQSKVWKEREGGCLNNKREGERKEVKGREKN